MILEIKKIHKEYNNKEVLKGVSLDINKGDIISIIGPSGSGKSTFLRCINKLEKIKSGDILFNGKEIKNEFEYRQKVGMVFQHFNLFQNLTVLENLTISPIKLKKLSKEEAIKKAKKLLKSVNLTDKENEYPNNLSGGQKQRVAILRALIMDPEVILFDEPTSALDPEMVDEVIDLMKKLANSGMTMLVVSHEMKFTKEVSTKIVFMDNGEIVEQGTKQDIFENSNNPRIKEFTSKIN